MSAMLKRVRGTWLPPLLFGFAAGAAVLLTTMPL
jgi:hypothetical protein